MIQNFDVVADPTATPMTVSQLEDKIAHGLSLAGDSVFVDIGGSVMLPVRAVTFMKTGELVLEL